MAYGFKLTGITIPENTTAINAVISDDTTPTEYALTGSVADGFSGTGISAVCTADGDVYDVDITVDAYTSEDVGDEYTINLALPEAPTQAFKEAVELVLPSSTFDVTHTLDFSNLETTATVAGNSFTKISTTSLTAEQLDGAIFKMGDDGIPITSDMLSDMSALGVTGTFVNIPDFGPVVFSCTEAGSVVSEPGLYLVTQMMSYVNSVTLSYQETYEATVKAIATGTAELTDNVSSLPDGVIYLQIEG